MSKSSLLLFLGSVVVITSFLGIPSSWKTIVFSALGAFIIATALLLRKDITTGALCMHLTQERQTDSYSQNGALHDNTKENNYVHTSETKNEKQGPTSSEVKEGVTTEHKNNQSVSKS